MNKNTQKISLPLEPIHNQNIDSRCVVQDLVELDNNNPIIGTLVYVVATNHFYFFNIETNRWERYVPQADSTDDTLTLDFGTY